MKVINQYFHKGEDLLEFC